jgi:hypothetical protein
MLPEFRQHGTAHLGLGGFGEQQQPGRSRRSSRGNQVMSPDLMERAYSAEHLQPKSPSMLHSMFHVAAASVWKSAEILVTQCNMVEHG